MGSQDDMAIFILINGLTRSSIVLKESKESLLNIIRAANLHEHLFFEKMLIVMADYADWMGMDAVARDFGLSVSDLKLLVPKKSRKAREREEA
jgi:hypothetical protein